MSTLIFGPQNEYELFEKMVIGKGAYGVIYECQRIVPDNQKAQSILLCVKITNCQGLGETEKKYQERENQINKIISNSSDNKNILKIYYQNYDQLNSKLMLVMERCQTNLKELLITKKTFSQNEIMDFVKQFANGYEVLYKEKVVHRDIKPENILVNEENGQYCYKLSDYGVGFKSMKEKSVVDMYSFGIVIYELATGNLPFKKSGMERIKKFFQEHKILPFKVMTKGLDIQLTELIESMLIYNPQKRLSFQDLRQKLQQLQLTNGQQQRLNTITNNTTFTQNNITFNYNNFVPFPQNQQRFPAATKFQPSVGNNQTQNNNSSNLNQPVNSNSFVPNFKQLNTIFSNQTNNNLNPPNHNQANQNFTQQKNNNDVPSQISQDFPQQNSQSNQQMTKSIIFHNNSQSFNSGQQQFANFGNNFQNIFQNQVSSQQFQQNTNFTNQTIIQKDQLIKDVIEQLKRHLQQYRNLIQPDVSDILEKINAEQWVLYCDKLYKLFQFEEKYENNYEETYLVFLLQLWSIRFNKQYQKGQTKAQIIIALKELKKI